ncbi:hypothetical protein PMAYCL1PPCAC_01872, partial [Pristionchus mayeri]
AINKGISIVGEAVTKDEIPEMSTMMKEKLEWAIKIYNEIKNDPRDQGNMDAKVNTENTVNCIIDFVYEVFKVR